MIGNSDWKSRAHEHEFAPYARPAARGMAAAQDDPMLPRYRGNLENVLTQIQEP